MASLSTSQRALVRALLAVCLTLLLVVGAWSNSHSETASVSSCVATGSAHTSVVQAQPEQGPADAASPAGLVMGLCALIVFLLLVARRAFRAQTLFRMDTMASASAPPRAGPVAVTPALSLTRLSISRT